MLIHTSGYFECQNSNRTIPCGKLSVLTNLHVKFLVQEVNMLKSPEKFLWIARISLKTSKQPDLHVTVPHWRKEPCKPTRALERLKLGKLYYPKDGEVHVIKRVVSIRMYNAWGKTIGERGGTSTLLTLRKVICFDGKETSALKQSIPLLKAYLK